jgi:hypothetical protein
LFCKRTRKNQNPPKSCIIKTTNRFADHWGTHRIQQIVSFFPDPKRGFPMNKHRSMPVRLTLVIVLLFTLSDEFRRG